MGTQDPSWGYATAPTLKSIPERRANIRSASESIARSQAYINAEERAMGESYGMMGQPMGAQEQAAAHWATSAQRDYQHRLSSGVSANEAAINAAIGSPGMRMPSRHLPPAKRSRR